MSRTTLDPVFAEAVGEQLATAGDKHSWFARRTRRVGAGIAVASGLAVAALVTGGAIYVAGFPGEESTVSTWPATTLTESGTGPSTMHLGPAPDGATHIRVILTCGSGYELASQGEDKYHIDMSDELGILDGDGEGTFIDCAYAERDHIKVDLSDFGDDGLVTIQAPTGAGWSATAIYVRIIASDWGVNANGDTYGVPNSVGVPDLHAAQATNGKIGYIYDDDLWCAAPNATSIPVYESDGETVIGEFPISNEEFLLLSTEGEPQEDIEHYVEPAFCH